ncbi:hypothetical protein DL770_003604 [Monosporascus sp. CRB-9-2]|nr:hypothetical protein DL770_003604 [Monosporascus sp. CRB-9-2]
MLNDDFAPLRSSSPEQPTSLGKPHALLDLDSHAVVGIDLRPHERQHPLGQLGRQHDDAVEVRHDVVARPHHRAVFLVLSRLHPQRHVHSGHLEQRRRRRRAHAACEDLFAWGAGVLWSVVCSVHAM